MNVTYHQTGTPKAASWIRRILLGWLMAAVLEYILVPPGLRGLDGLSGIARMSLVRLILTTGLVTAVLTLLERWVTPALQRWMMLAAALMLAVFALDASFTLPFLAACVLVILVILGYAILGWNGRAMGRGIRYKEDKRYRYLLVGLTLLFFLLVSAWTVARVLSFSVPTFDFGIFSQMFHSMRTRGLPITTVERDGPLSHFAVHVSPIYYLLLPFYWLIPTPAMLQVLQAAVLASAVIPLWKLGRHHGLKPLPRLLMCCVLLLYPAYAGGASYDIHENAFLTPLILWLFYGIDRRNIPATGLAAVLTLMVKEDAAVYVAVIGVYLILRGSLNARGKWDLMAGGILVAGALGWFLAVTGYLAKFGDGVMTYRYKNFMYDGSDSLVTVIKAVLLCPMKAVFECVDPEKLKFIGLTMLPLGCLPLLTRRYERYFLLIPYILVNLMSDYQYQHDIFFQYTYGATGCLIYMTLVNLADIRVDWKRVLALALVAGIGLGCFSAQILPKVKRYTGYLSTYGDYYDRIRQVLDVVPEDASVAATTYYTTYLSQRDVLYDVRYASTEHLLECAYVVVGVSDSGLKKFKAGDLEGYDGLMVLLTQEGYEKIAEYSDRLEIYRRK